MLKSSRIIPLALVLAVSFASVASAASPPKGNYGCTYSTFSGTFYAGTINILSKTKYSVNKKGKGKYSTRGKRIKFKTGAYKGLWKGKWSKGKSVLNGSTYYEIDLTALKKNDKGFEGVPTMSCTRDRK
jgi:hypothetical protein